MFEKIGQSAEKVVTKLSLSRRGFLASAAKGAAALGAALAAFAASPAQAGRKVTGIYLCEDGSQQVKSFSGSSCPQFIKIKGSECFCVDCHSP